MTIEVLMIQLDASGEGQKRPSAPRQPSSISTSKEARPHRPHPYGNRGTSAGDSAGRRSVRSGDFAAASINRGGRGGFSNTLPREGREPPRDTPRDATPEEFTYSYQMFHVGTLISATPRVDDSGSILLDFKAEQSRLADTHAAKATSPARPGLSVSAPSRLIAKPRCG